MNTPNTGTSSSRQYSGQQTQGHDSPLTDATYNMVSALHNLVDACWHYDTYIQQESDDDAKEMWRRFKQQDMQKAAELRDHLSRRLQHETGPAGKAGHGPHESSQHQ
jgi:hypothetical protein